ncbi:MAG: hypothetical protein FJ215_13380 [Ignavibacteria bacterium]|nr:hypothetical protein [Ignavibacteria bacterium]
MAKTKRVTYFKTRVEDRPGALLALAQDLKSKELGLIALKGVSQGGHGEILVVAKNADKLREHWNAAGILAEEGTAFLISGTDKTGALVKSLEALKEAGVNIVAIEAVAAGEKFGTVVWVDPADIEKTAQALRVK